MLHYKLLNCRKDASTRETEALTQNTDLVLHPDKDGFKQWLMKKKTTVDMITYEEGKAKVPNCFQVWKSTRDRLCEVDQGNYQKAICTHT
jgi:hypothetical protein